METIQIFDVDKEMAWYRLDKSDYQKMKTAINISNGRKFNKLSLDGKFIKTMNNIREAAEQVGIHPSVLRCCLRGEYKTAGGYKWEYV